jgi:hypothetical protein
MHRHGPTAIFKNILIILSKPLDNVVDDFLRFVRDLAIINVEAYCTLRVVNDLIPYARIVGIHLETITC